MIKTPCKMIVDARGKIHHGKIVNVISPAGMQINGQTLYDCVCVDGSGGGALPENILKPIKE